MRAVAAAIVLLAGLLAGCSLLPEQLQPSAPDRPTEQPSIGVKVVTPLATVPVTAINTTSMPVVLVVNDKTWDMAPGSDLKFGVTDLGPAPWDFAFRTVGGRELLAGSAHDGDFWEIHLPDGSTHIHTPELRVDLSCGQLRVLFGPPHPSTMPGKGTPGDCDP